jgi:rhodanese-related sulfurtransferase
MNSLDQLLKIGVCIMDSIRISPEEANAMSLRGKPVIFLDDRNPTAWGESDRKIPGAIRVPADSVEDHIHEINKDSTVIAYCT